MRRQAKLIRELVFLPTHWWQMWAREDTPLQAEKWKYGAHAQQYALYYQPEGVEFTQKPLVVFFHGGAWQFGRPELFRAQARFFLKQGFAVVLPSYRKLPAHNFKHMLSDLEQLCTYINEQFNLRQWVTRQVIAGGMSAGGHLATHLAFHPNLQSIETAGLFTCGAPLDLNQLDNSLTRRRLAGGPDAGADCRTRGRNSGRWSSRHPGRCRTSPPSPGCPRGRTARPRRGRGRW